MSSRILSSSRPDSWIPYLLDKAWNATTEGVFNLLRGNESLNPVCRLAEVAVINVLKKIDHGHLSVVTPTRTYTFPSTDVPHKETVYDNEEIVEIRVLESTFWLRLGIMSDLGFAEAYMFSEVDCDNLPALFRLFLNNRDAFATLNSPFSSVFIRISGVIAKSRFLNSLGNAQGNIGAHYDISNDMFIAFLSKDMTYSCAIFPDLDADLYPVDRAQDTKKPTGSDQRNAVTKENAFSMEVIDTLLSYPSPPVHDFAYPSASSGSLGSPASPSPPLFALSSVSGEFPLADASAFTTSSSGPQGALLDAEASTSTFVTSTSFPNEEEKASTSGELVTKFNKLQGGIEAEDEDELYQAQVRKLDYIIKKADIRPGHRVLEIGSGWGSLALRIAQNIPDTTVDTITLSLQQQQFVQKRILETSYSAGDGDGYVDRDGKHRVRVHLMDYRAMPIEWEHSFDRVVSIEMIEAVGKEYLELYWAQIDWALKRHTGAGVIQCITIPEALISLRAGKVKHPWCIANCFWISIVLLPCVMVVFPYLFYPVASTSTAPRQVF
ncbi:unnamed protein product [Somion occarium]|uniref:Cyclopropane-fatty-acyl-phospholipid synthase n=1 Tax=Somion occarium TaxID=3059160 RepID=A0ABP1DYU0_9APHY